MKKLLSTKYAASSFNIALLFIRVTAGTAMAFGHGYGKLVGFSQRAGKFADPFHIGSATSLSLTIFAEFFCAFFVVFGLFTRLACIPLIIAMSVALFYANGARLYGGGELAGIYLAVFLGILLVGPGKISIDATIGK